MRARLHALRPAASVGPQPLSPDALQEQRPPGEWARGPDAAPRVRGWRAPDADAARKAPWSRNGKGDRP
jgi:hypothetical protein